MTARECCWVSSVASRGMASGVSDQSGSIARFSETVLSVSAFSLLRRTLGLSQTQTLNNLPYVLRGKLAGGLFGTVRFVDTGKLRLPRSTARNSVIPTMNIPCGREPAREDGVSVNTRFSDTPHSRAGSLLQG